MKKAKAKPKAKTPHPFPKLIYGGTKGDGKFTREENNIYTSKQEAEDDAIHNFDPACFVAVYVLDRVYRVKAGPVIEEPIA